jgi:integrase
MWCTMPDKPISPMRQRMIDDMTVRRFSEATRKDYVRNVRLFAAFLGQSPDTVTCEDLRRVQLHMAQRQIGPETINAAVAGLRIFFKVTLERPDLVRPLRIVNEPRRAPVVLSQEEVARLLEAAPDLKYKAALSVAYGAGLRVSEVAKVSDIDRERMTLRVEQGKGQRNRTVMLQPRLLVLRANAGRRRGLRSGSFPARTRPTPWPRTNAMSARTRQSSFHRCDRLASAHRRHRKRPPSPLPTKTSSAAGSGRRARQPSAILKSPFELAKRSLTPRGFPFAGFRAPAPTPAPPSQGAGAEILHFCGP